MNKVNKKCSKCKKTKNVSEFSKSKSTKDSLQYQCKDCVKAYRVTNKEKVVEYYKSYRIANKDKFKGYEEANKERALKHRESKKLPYHIVYALPNFNNSNEVYCGVTESTHQRMINHKSEGRNTEGWFILDVVKTKEEALDIEKSYHEQGYKGAKGWYNKKVA